MVGSRGLGSSPDWGHYVVLHSHSASLHPGVWVTGKVNVRRVGAVMGGGVEMHLVTS